MAGFVRQTARFKFVDRIRASFPEGDLLNIRAMGTMEEMTGRLSPVVEISFPFTGKVIPAPRALDLHPVRIENGIVKVDTGRTLKRRYFEASQVARV